MGMSVNTSGRGSGRRGRRHKAISEINMTPMVDVMLVLLIIFMVSAPLMTVGVPIELPETAANQLNSNTEPLTVSIDTRGRVFLQDTEIRIEEVVPKLKAIAKSGYDEQIFVRGDRTVDYGAVMQVMGRLSAAGFRKIGLVTDQERSG